MDSQTVVWMIFLGLTMGVLAVGMLARDVAAGLSGGRGVADGTQQIRLRRVTRTGRDLQRAARGLGEGERQGGGERQDAASTVGVWFERLVRETGWGWTPMAAALLVSLAALLASGVVFLWTDHPVAASASGWLAAGLVIMVLVVQRMRRIALLQTQFPVALELIARSVRAGHNLDEAIVLAGREGSDPLAAEFRSCAHQLALGLGVPAAVRSLADRLPLADVRIFAALLGIHRETGGNIAEVLERLALAIRERISYHRQLRAITSAGRLSALLVAAMGPILFVYMLLFHPEYARTMLETPLGQTFLVTAVVMEVIGVAWTAKLVKPMY